MTVLAYVGLAAAIVILSIVIILLLANLRAYLTKITLGTTVFINAGDNLKKIIPNVGGFKMSGDGVEDLEGRHWLIPAENAKDRMDSLFHKTLPGTIWFQKWLWKQFGVRFVSWFWPQVRVHQFDLRKGGRRRIGPRAPDAPLRSRIIDSEDTRVDSLLFLVPRPVLVEGVELAGDNSKINLLLLPVFRQVIPALPVYYLTDFFALLDAALEAAMVDFFAHHRVAVYRDEGQDKEKKGTLALDSYELPKDVLARKEYEERYEEVPLTYAHWLKLTKAGENSPIEKYLRRLNITAEYLRKMENAGGRDELVEYIKKDLLPEEVAVSAAALPGKIEGMIPSGIVPRFGFALISFRIVEWEPHSSTTALAEALLARETEFHTAEGVRQKAFGERDRKLAEAKGESGRFEQLATALIGKGVSPDVAAQVVETLLRTENIRDSSVTTYVEGGGKRASLLVAPPPPAPKQP